MGTIWKKKKQRRTKKKRKTTNRLDTHRPSHGRSWTEHFSLYSVESMNKRLLRAVAVTSGLTLVGAIMGIPIGHAHSWYRAVANDPAPTFWGAGVGFIIGLILSLALELFR